MKAVVIIPPAGDSVVVDRAGGRAACHDGAGVDQASGNRRLTLVIPSPAGHALVVDHAGVIRARGHVIARGCARAQDHCYKGIEQQPTASEQEPCGKFVIGPQEERLDHRPPPPPASGARPRDELHDPRLLPRGLPLRCLASPRRGRKGHRQEQSPSRCLSYQTTICRSTQFILAPGWTTTVAPREAMCPPGIGIRIGLSRRESLCATVCWTAARSSPRPIRAGVELERPELLARLRPKRTEK